MITRFNNFYQHLWRTTIIKSIRLSSSSSIQIPEHLIPVIPKDSIKKSFCRSSGPGGQNVNNVSTKAEIRFGLNDDWIPSELRPVISRKYSNRLNNEGEVVITSTKTRSQIENLDDCFEKLHDMFRMCAFAVIHTERKTPNDEDSKILNARLERAAYIRRIEKERHSAKKRFRSKDFD